MFEADVGDRDSRQTLAGGFPLSGPSEWLRVLVPVKQLQVRRWPGREVHGITVSCAHASSQATGGWGAGSRGSGTRILSVKGRKHDTKKSRSVEVRFKSQVSDLVEVTSTLLPTLFPPRRLAHKAGVRPGWWKEGKVGPVVASGRCFSLAPLTGIS